MIEEAIFGDDKGFSREATFFFGNVWPFQSPPRSL